MLQFRHSNSNGKNTGFKLKKYIVIKKIKTGTARNIIGKIKQNTK